MSPADVEFRGDTRRLFVASWPSDDWRDRHAERLTKLEWACGGRRVPPSNFHLTLAFLGAVGPTRMDAVRECLGRARGPAFDLTLDRVDYWPKPRILCLTATDAPQSAGRLVQSLWQGLSRLGFQRDMRPFKAHLTLARHVERRPVSGIAPRLVWPVERIALVESKSTTDGPVYAPQDYWPLTSSSS